MSAIEQCRTAALGAHVLRCEARQADLLPVAYYHVVFTLPAPISVSAYVNKAVIYRLLFEVRPKHWGPSPPTPSIWARRLARHWSCTLGGRR